MMIFGINKFIKNSFCYSKIFQISNIHFHINNKTNILLKFYPVFISNKHLKNVYSKLHHKKF